MGKTKKELIEDINKKLGEEAIVIPLNDKEKAEEIMYKNREKLKGKSEYLIKLIGGE